MQCHISIMKRIEDARVAFMTVTITTQVKIPISVQIVVQEWMVNRMSDLIDRQDAIRKIVMTSVERQLDVEAVATCINILQNMPTYKHGEKGDMEQ